MRKRNTIRIAIITVVVAGALLLLKSAASNGKGKASKESMEQCCKKNPGRTSWESLSQQFFSSI
jgi:hypothetical protein